MTVRDAFRLLAGLVKGYPPQPAEEPRVPCATDPEHGLGVRVKREGVWIPLCMKCLKRKDL